LNPIFLTVVGAMFILCLAIVKLVIYGRKKAVLNALLCIGIFGIVWYALVYLLTVSKQIQYYPILFNKGLPLYYCVAPCFYLYIRGALDNRFERPRKLDYLHFLIALPAVASILPYTFLSLSAQSEVVAKAVADVRFAFGDSAYIVGAWHWFAFPISALVYTFLQFRFTLMVSKRGKKNLGWVYLFTGICALIFLGLLLINIAVLHNIDEAGPILTSSKFIIFLCFCFLGLSTLFFINPEFLYGFIPVAAQEKRPVLVETIAMADEVAERREEASEIKMIDSRLIEQVEICMSETGIFRRSGLTLSELSSVLDVPNHKLSELFNNHFKQNFNSYINTLRIDYILTRLDHGDWRQFTLEAIANDAGFTSRNTFFTAFKKVKGLSPSSYLSGLKASAA